LAFRTYAFRIGKDADLLDEEEWSQVAPFLTDRFKWIRKYMKETGCTLEDARQFEPVGQSALDTYEEITGVRLDHPEQLWGLRMKDYGSLCPKCSRPFRTPKAKLCAECGFELPAGLRAGGLGEHYH